MRRTRCDLRKTKCDALSATLIVVIACAVSLVARDAAGQAGLQSSDLLKLRSVSAVQVSPDAMRVAYVVDNNDGAGRPYGQLWVMTLADGKSVRFGGDWESSGGPEWSPDGQAIAYHARMEPARDSWPRCPTRTARCRRRGRRWRGRLTANASRSSRPCRDRKP